LNKKFVDVSSYNGAIKWPTAKAKGVEGAIIKIIRKDLSRDNQFNNNYRGCNKNKIPWGVYNYSYATTVEKAKSDMKLVCDILDKIDKEYFQYGVWFDIEDKIQASLSKSKIAEIINAAQKVVEDRGYKFGVYTGMSYYAEHMDASKINCKNWWIARYYKGYDTMKISTTPNASYKPSKPSGIFAWQYTSSGVITSGVSTGNKGHFDLNIIYKEMKSKKTTSTNVVSGTSTSYYKKYTGTSKKIDVVFKAIGAPNGSVSKRKLLAAKNGISNYTGTETQNLKLIALAKEGKLKKV
jgi:GH25 family lysozyme M1 (1,4-beta-N-acetylmuramidase)